MCSNTRRKGNGSLEDEPTFVIGDGKLSVGELIDIENAKPNRNTINGSMKPIPLDEVSQKI